MENNIEITQSGIKCDNPDCDFRDDSVKSDEYEKWLNVPCPKCGQNLLTEEDFNTAEMLKLSADFINTLSVDELKELSKIAEDNGIMNDPVFKDTKGMGFLKDKSDKEITIRAETHGGLKFTEIKEAE